MESKQLVRLVMERVDAENAEAFAERMGWGFDRVRLIRLWLAGTSQPSYPYLMEMLEAAVKHADAGPAPLACGDGAGASRAGR